MEQEQTVGIWVKCSERLPETNGYYPTQLDTNKPGFRIGLIHYHKDTGWQNGFYNDAVIEWLDEQTGYFLTPDQYKSLIESVEVANKIIFQSNKKTNG